MKIWVVHWGDSEDTFVEYLFSTHEKALARVAEAWLPGRKCTHTKHDPDDDPEDQMCDDWSMDYDENGLAVEGWATITRRDVDA